jgi:hypothetical protein
VRDVAQPDPDAPPFAEDAIEARVDLPLDRSRSRKVGSVPAHLVNVVAVGRVQDAEERGRARLRPTVVDDVKDPEPRAARPAVARRSSERDDVDREATDDGEVVFERAEVLSSRDGGGEELFVSVRLREELAENGEDLPSVAVADEEDAITGAKRASAVESERASEANRPLDPGGVMVLAGPDEVDRLDPGRARERVDVRAREVGEIADDPRDLRPRETAQGATETGQRREGLADDVRDRERVVADERPVGEEDETDAGAPHASADVAHLALPFGCPLGRALGEHEARGLGRRKLGVERRPVDVNGARATATDDVTGRKCRQPDGDQHHHHGEEGERKKGERDEHLKHARAEVSPSLWQTERQAPATSFRGGLPEIVRREKDAPARSPPQLTPAALSPLSPFDALELAWYGFWSAG